MAHVFNAPVAATVPVFGTDDVFPVHRIYCVGRNYAEHAKEMGHTGREAPFFFMKPADAVLPVAPGAIGEMPYPSMTGNLHHEVELVVAIGKDGNHIAVEDAAQYVWGYAVGLDMTRRDVQQQAKEQGRPWCTGKGFDLSAPIAPIYPVTAVKDIENATIYLDVNGQPRQRSDIGQLIWNIPEVIAHLSQYFSLKAGDLIFTGTPAGVAAVTKGDVIVAGIAGLGELKLAIVER